MMQKESCFMDKNNEEEDSDVDKKETEEDCPCE